MKFLFEPIAFKIEKPIYYRIYQVDDSKYYAEVVNDGSETLQFFFKKLGAQWHVDDSVNENLCQQLGEEVDNFTRAQ